MVDGELGINGEEKLFLATLFVGCIGGNEIV